MLVLTDKDKEAIRPEYRDAITAEVERLNRNYPVDFTVPVRLSTDADNEQISAESGANNVMNEEGNVGASTHGHYDGDGRLDLLEIILNRHVFGIDGRSNKFADAAFVEATKDAHAGMHGIDYILAHEYGHVWDTTTLAGSPNERSEKNFFATVWFSAPKNITRYSSTSVVEGFAEAFAGMDHGSAEVRKHYEANAVRAIVRRHYQEAKIKEKVAA